MANSTNNLNLFTPDSNSPLVYKNISFFGELSQANLQERLPNFGVVYALELANGLVKIGCTSRPAKRIQELKKTMSMYGNVYVTRVALSEACTNYKTLEAELHKFFKKFRVDGELFQVDILDVINTVGQMYLISQQSQVLSTDVVTEWVFELMTKGQVSLKGKVPLTRAEIKSIIEAKVRDTVSNALAKPKPVEPPVPKPVEPLVLTIKLTEFETQALEQMDVWINTHIIFDPNAQTRIGRAYEDDDGNYKNTDKWLYPSYCQFCKTQNAVPISSRRFSQLLALNKQCQQHDVKRLPRASDGMKFQGLKLTAAANMDVSSP